MDEEKYLKLYTIAHNNAVKLLADAEILMEHKSYPTAYFLALSALEEISKSQCAADVSTGVMKEKHFWEIYQNHPAKIGFMDEYSERANEYPDKIKWNGPDDIEIVSPETPTFEKRNAALYVSLDKHSQVIKTPSDCISEKDAKEIIYVVDLALSEIVRQSEEWGHQIGTKGRMK